MVSLRRKEMNRNLKFFWLSGYGLLMFSGLALIIFSCAPRTLPSPTRGNDGGLNPSYHAWRLLPKMDSEEPGYAMYTYVLFARRHNYLQGVNPQTKERYESLLGAIAGTTMKAEKTTQFPKEETNLFCIPAVFMGKKPSLPNYNVDIAMRYLSMLGKMLKEDNYELADRLMTQPGPFLISTLKPINVINEMKTPLLYTDLSGTNPAAMGEVVAAYKRRVTGRALTDVENFYPLRLALLNLILNADDNVKLVKVALAEWIPE